MQKPFKVESIFHSQTSRVLCFFCGSREHNIDERLIAMVTPGIQQENYDISTQHGRGRQRSECLTLS